MAKGSLLGDIEDAVKACKPANWFNALPKETQTEFLEIRKTLQSGGYPVSRGTLARILFEKCKERGLHTLGERRLCEWLQKS